MGLEVKNLSIKSSDRVFFENLSFSLQTGEILGLSGKSGIGKTMIIKSILDTLDLNLEKSGDVFVDGKNLSSISHRRRRNMCGTKIAYIPQFPMQSFDPRLTIEKQLIETYRYKLKIGKTEAKELIVDSFEAVNLKDLNRILGSRPNELSGGMLQRVVFSFILAMKPKYILADEPSSALDEENSEILFSLFEKVKESSSILLVSHNYKALKRLSDKLLILCMDNFYHYRSFQELEKDTLNPWVKSFVETYERTLKWRA